MSTKLYLPKYCILEAPIRECIEIPEAAKIYFGELAVLACKYNYIPYTDEQLAEMKGVDVKTIKRWNYDLEKHGFITKESKNTLVESDNGSKWIRKRKIYVNQNPDSKKVCGKDKNVPADDRDKNVPADDRDKNVPSYKQDEKDKIINNNPTPSGSSSSSLKTYECLDKLNLTANEKRKLTEKIEEGKAIELVKRVMAWKTRGKDIVAVNTILRDWDEWENPQETEKPRSKTTKSLNFSKLSKEDEEFFKRGYLV